MESDPVEFSVSNDRRTGKPIAVSVVRLDLQTVMPEVISDERFVGTVIQEAKPVKGKNVSKCLLSSCYVQD